MKTKALASLVASLLLVPNVVAAVIGACRSDIAQANVGGVMVPIPSATIRLCTRTSATSAPCPVLANLYTDNTLALAKLVDQVNNPIQADANGNFNVCSVPGSYVLQISAIGFATFTVPNYVIPIDMAMSSYTLGDGTATVSLTSQAGASTGTPIQIQPSTVPSGAGVQLNLSGGSGASGQFGGSITLGTFSTDSGLRNNLTLSSDLLVTQPSTAVNQSSVTANANSTSAQNLTLLGAFGTRAMNGTNKTILYESYGQVTSQAGQTPTLTFTLQLGGITLATVTTPTLVANSTTNWEFQCFASTSSPGATGTLQTQCKATLNNVAPTLSAPTTSAAISLLNAQALQLQATFSTQPGAGPFNSITQNFGGSFPKN